MKHRVLCGIDNIDMLDCSPCIRVGLITNFASHSKNGSSTIDIIKKRYNLCALFAPEHGLTARLAAGQQFTDEDEKVIPIFSLYGDNCAPTNKHLEIIDALIYDIQDVGVRHYTYLSTLTHSMKACADTGKTLFLLDRPNPLGGIVNGEMLNPKYKSFVGEYPIPTRYGLTIGEYANFVNKTFSIGCDLRIIPITGWSHNMLWSETDLKWFSPSPNIPDFETCFYYLVTCFLEATNISEGRGTEFPFRQFGSPSLKSNAIAKKLNGLHLPNIEFEECEFTPDTSKFVGKVCNGIRLHIDNYESFDACLTKLSIINILKSECTEITFTSFLENLLGRDEIRKEFDPYKLSQSYQAEADLFGNSCEQYKIYN